MSQGLGVLPSASGLGGVHSPSNDFSKLQELQGVLSQNQAQNVQNSVKRIQENNLRILNNNVDLKILNTRVEQKAQMVGAQLNLVKSILSEMR